MYDIFLINRENKKVLKVSSEISQSLGKMFGKWIEIHELNENNLDCKNKNNSSSSSEQ